MSLLIPEPLKAGGRVALIAPSSPVPEESFSLSIESIRFLGLEPVVYESCKSDHGYLAGEDELRASDVMKAFTDDDIHGIFCLRGGYGSTRILPLLDFEEIGKHPKRFFGFSDITGLHTAINSLSGFATFHAPMPTTGYHLKDEYTIERLRRCVFEEDMRGRIHNPDGIPFKTINPGHARGQLTGGNLDLLAATLGSPYEIDTRGKILFIEVVDRRPYDIDMMMTALSLAGKFSDAEGIVLGMFERCDEWEDFPTLEIDDIIREVVKPCGRPVIAGFQAGHSYPQTAFPLGADAVIDTDNDFIEIV